MKYLMITLGLALALVLAGCGDDESSGDDDTTSTDAPAATDPPATDPPATDPPATEPPATDPPAVEPPATTPVAVELTEWSVDAPATYDAGTLEITATNVGEFNHEFVIVEGTYAELPQEANGAVIEDDLEILARTETLRTGESETVTVDLAPGNYLFFCNITIGPRSHAGAGQTLDVAVG